MKAKFFSLSLIFTSLFVSCVSTDIIEPEDHQFSNELILSISTPEEVATRADNGYKLRYIAKIFRGSSSAAWGSPLDRQEIIDGEKNNQIIFKVEPNDNYAIMVFADYIPANSQPGSNGLYDDYFYNTQLSQRSTLRTTPGSDVEEVSPAFFNNHNYDSFFAIEKLYKDIDEKTVNMTLKRITAQVIFREKNDHSGQCNVTVNKLGVRKNFDYGISQSSDPSATEANKNLGNINLPQSTLEGNNDLFFFYTLADATPQYVSTEFKVTKDGETSDAFTVKEIPVTSNYKTIVTSNFLKDDPSSDIPDDDPTKSGDIILNMTTDFSWQQETLSK